MSPLVVAAESILAGTDSVTDDCLAVELKDGLSLAVPLAWYPRLQRQ